MDSTQKTTSETDTTAPESMKTQVDGNGADASGSYPANAQDADKARELKLWRKRVKDARKLRKDWEKDYRVKASEKYYLGDQYDNLPDNTGVVNHFLSTIRVTLPNLVFDDPKFMARIAPGYSAPAPSIKAKVAEGVLTTVAKRDDNLRKAARLAILQNFWRMAVVKVVYDPTLVPNPDAGNPIYQQDANGNVIYDQNQQPAPEIDPVTGQPILEPAQVMKKEAYRFEWVDAAKVLLPDEGPDQAKWTWVGEEISIPLSDAKIDERFPQELRVQFKSSSNKPSETGQKSKYRGDDDDQKEKFDEEEKFTYVLIYDIKNKKMLAVADDNKLPDFIIDEPTPEGIIDHPYGILPGWLPNIGPEPSPWPKPYTSDWLDLQDNYNLRRLQQRNGAARSARKVLTTKDMFDNDEEARKALQSNTDMEAVVLKDIMRKPEVMQDPDINPAIYQDAITTLTDWRLITGQTGAKAGQASADTATEASFVEQASNLRDTDLQNDVNSWFRTLGYKMLELISKTLTLDMWVGIRGMADDAINMYLSSMYGIPQQAFAMFPALKDEIVRRYGENKISRVTREDLNGDFQIIVVPGSSKPRNLAVEKAQFLEFVTLIAQAPQIALARGLLEELAAKFDFVNDAMIEEMHAMAMVMVQLQQQTAGRGGGSSAPQNTPGAGASQVGHAQQSQAAQGNEMGG